MVMRERADRTWCRDYRTENSNTPGALGRAERPLGQLGMFGGKHFDDEEGARNPTCVR